MQALISGPSAGNSKMTLKLTVTALIGAGLLSSASVWAQAAAESTEPSQTQTVVVTGVKASMMKSLANKRLNDQVVESIVAEDIGKLPDNNVVEALQRVTGVQVTNRSAGEVAGISIRGLPDVQTTWNGRNVFTASGTQVQLQDIPSSLVRQIDVYKTRDASQLETGIAGQVDVKTLRPFDIKGRRLSLLARETYLDPAQKWNPQLSALASNRWETSIGEIGALINLTGNQTKYRNQSVTPGAMVPFVSPNASEVPPGYTPLQRITDNNIWQAGTRTGLPQAEGSTLNFGGKAYPYYLARDAVFQADTVGERKRPAANIALQWKPNSDSVYTFETMYNGYRDKFQNKLLFSFADWWGDLGSNPAGTIKTFPGTNVIQSRQLNNVYAFNSGDLTTSKTDSYIYALNGKWDLGDRLRLEGDLSYQTSEYNTEFTASRIDRVHPSINVAFNDGSGDTAFGFNNNNADLTDPAKWNVAQFYDNANRNKGSAGTATLAGTFDAGWGPLESLQFGARHDVRKVSEANRTQSATLNRNLASLSNEYTHYNSNFGTDISEVPRSWVTPNGYFIRDTIDDWRKLYNAADKNFLTTDKLRLQETFDIEEKTSNLYFMGNFEQQVFGKRLRANAGLRYTKVDTDMTFYKVDPVSKAVTASGASQSTSKVLPSLTVTYDAAKDVMVRVNYGETLRRPNFASLNPVLQLSDDISRVGYGSGTGGNPDLKPTESKNLDLTAEWYFQKDSALFGTVFQRKIEGLEVPLYRRISVGPGEDTFRNQPGHENGYDYVILSPTNASDGKIKGIELGFTYFPKGLPTLLDGLGFQGSYTRLSSTQNVPEADSAGNIVNQLETGFFGVSDRSYNATVAYEKGPVSARLSYVWRSAFLSVNEAALFANPLGIWRQPERSLDMQMSYKFSDNLSVDISGINLTNAMQRQYYNFGSAGNPTVTNFGTGQTGRSVSVGLRLKM